jgi:hypothetical protein
MLEEELESRIGAGDEVGRQVVEMRGRSDRPHSGPSPSSFFILSAAAHWDLLAMWRCYGGSGESYAIGLDADQSLPVLADPEAPAVAGEGASHLVQQRPWTPVRYSTAEQRSLAEAVFDGMAAELTALEDRIDRDGALTREAVLETLGETLDDIEQALVLIKHPGFHDEREVRHSTVLMHPYSLADWSGVIHYRPSRYGMAPHLWLTGSGRAREPQSLFTTEVAPLPIRAVAISPSPNGPAAQESLAAMLADHGYDVEVRRSEIPFRG